MNKLGLRELGLGENKKQSKSRFHSCEILSLRSYDNTCLEFSPLAEQAFYEPEASSQIKKGREAYARELPGAEGGELPGDPDAGEDSLAKTPTAGITPQVALHVVSSLRLCQHFPYLSEFPNLPCFASFSSVSQLCKFSPTSRISDLCNGCFIVD